MKKLAKDFSLKFIIVCSLAFFFAFSISYFYMKKNLISEEIRDMNKYSSSILFRFERDARDFRNFIQKQSFEKIIEIIEKGDKIYHASFITLVDHNGRVIKRNSNVVGDSISNEEFFKYIIDLKENHGFFHYINSVYLERELLTTHLTDKQVLFYSSFIPYNYNNKRYFIWYGSLPTDISDYFSDLNVFDIKGAILWDGKKILAKYLDRNDQVLSDDKIVINSKNGQFVVYINGKKSFAYETKIEDFNKKYLASLILVKNYSAIYDKLYRYTGYILMIFIFSSFVGITFVVLYFKKIRQFILELTESFKQISDSKEIIKITNSGVIAEFNHISNSLAKLSMELKDQKKLLEEKINSYINEYFTLYRAIHEMDSKQTFTELIEYAVEFLRETFRCRVLYPEEYEKLDEKEKIGLRKVSFVYSSKDYGFYVEEDIEKKGIFPINFWELFFEIFKTNFERIANFREVQKSFNEANYFSNVLMKLLQKHDAYEIFIYILEKAKEFCKGDCAYLGVYDKNERMIKLQFFIGIKTEEFKTLTFQEDKGLGGYVLKHMKPVFVENYFEDSRIDSPFKEIVMKEGIISVIAAPIIYENEIYGILYVAYRDRKNNLTSELNFIEKLANIAAISLERERLIIRAREKEEELRKAYDELLEKRKEINALLKNYKEANLELERKNLELNEQYEIVKKSYEELDKLNKAKDIFLGILSHELKTPLTILKGYIDALLSPNFQHTSEVKDILINSKKSITNLWQIIEDLLDYSRIQMGKIEILTKKVSAEDLVESLKDEINIYLKERNLDLIVNVQKDLILKIDTRWIKRALVNLLTNAIKFTPDGKRIILSIEKVLKEDVIYPEYVLERPIEDTEYILIKVEDQGIGINLNEINRIFEKFYEIGDIKEHSSGKYKFLSKGLGLGLSFVKQIVNLHGGVVFAESKGYDPENCPGSIFKIYLPAKLEEKKEDLVTVQDRKGIVLIIEKEHEVASFLEMVFSPNFDVVIVSDGGAGYLKVLEVKPSVIFINTNLGAYTGYEICSMIKEDKRIQNIPVILYSSGVESFDELRAQNAKANMFFSPLFDVENLLRIVKYYTNKVNS